MYAIFVIVVGLHKSGSKSSRFRRQHNYIITIKKLFMNSLCELGYQNNLAFNAAERHCCHAMLVTTRHQSFA